LLADAHAVHRTRFDTAEVEGAILLSIKTGGCPEDCAYCPQSSRYQTGVAAQGLLATEVIVTAALNAKAAGATRFCMGAAWGRRPTGRLRLSPGPSARSAPSGSRPAPPWGC
jgi:biotin synthase